MTIVNPVPITLQNGLVADATQVMANFNAIVADVNAGAAALGANSDITALLALTTPISYLLGGTSVWIGGTVTGTANAVVLAAPTPLNSFVLTAGFRVSWIPTAVNTGALTLNVRATGVKNVLKLAPGGLVACTGGETPIGVTVEAIYDGTQFVLLSNALSVLGPSTNIASATTTDLGSISSHVINITGVTTITGFGSSATLTFPIYLVEFTGVLTLTHSASLALPGAVNITTAASDAALLEYMGSGNWRVSMYSRASGLPVVASTGMLKGIQAFTTGSGTYTPTAGATRGIVILTGGGGGGGGAGTTASIGATGGGAGATAFLYVSALASVSYAVGAGGTAGAAAGGTGGNGGQSSFGTTTANGGNGGPGRVNNNAAVGGATQSTTANATFSIPGSAGMAPNQGQLDSGAGAGSFWGGGAPGVVSGANSAGITAVSPGAGASGGYRLATTDQAGGVGAPGIVVVLEFQ